MAKVIFKGTDRRVLSAQDLKVDGFETTTFVRNEPTEVTDEVAKLLLGKPRTFGRFITAPADAEAPASDEGTPSPDSTSQLGVDSPAGSTAADTTSGSTRRKA